MTDRATRTGITIAFIGLAVMVHMLLAWYARNPGFMTGQDDAQYLILGQSIRAGGYHELFRVDRPVHALYPPGYPAVLAVWGAVVGDRYDGLVALSVAFGGGALLVLGLTLRRLTEPALAVAATWLLALNADVISYSGSISSEAPFMFLSVASLSLLAWGGDSRRILLLAGLSAVLAALTRVAGVTLLGAIGLHWLLERRTKATGWLVLASAVTVGIWLVWTAVAPDQYEGVSYANDLAAGFSASPGIIPFHERLLVNAIFYLRRLSWTVAPTLQGTIVDNVIASGLLIAATLAGLATLMGRWRPASLYGFAYGGLLLVWTWTIPRYLVPIEVVLIPAIVLGIASLVARVRPAWSVPASLAGALILGGTSGFRTAEMVATRSGCDRSGDMPPVNCLTPQQASFFDALRYIKRETPPDAVLLAAKYVTVNYYTGRLTASFRGALARDSAAMVPFLRQQGVTHVLLGRLLLSEGNELAPKLRAVCRDLVVERDFGEVTFLFRLATARPRDGEAESACSAIDEYLHRTAGDDFGESLRRVERPVRSE